MIVVKKGKKIGMRKEMREKIITTEEKKKDTTVGRENMRNMKKLLHSNQKIENIMNRETIEGNRRG